MSLPFPSKRPHQQPPTPTTLTGPPFDRTMGYEMVDIYVGEGANENLCSVHKKQVCMEVEYFDNMFNDGFKEAQENVATMPKDDPDAMDALLD